MEHLREVGVRVLIGLNVMFQSSIQENWLLGIPKATFGNLVHHNLRVGLVDTTDPHDESEGIFVFYIHKHH